jgi:hypothetical protein
MVKNAFAIAAALALAAPAFAQDDLRALTCADYNAADQAQKNGYAANIRAYCLRWMSGRALPAARSRRHSKVSVMNQTRCS